MAEKNGRKRGNVTNLGVLTDIHGRFERYCEHHDRKMGATVDRLIDWFLRQDDVVKLSILNDCPEKLSEAARVVLCAMAAEMGGCDRPPKAGTIIHHQSDRVVDSRSVQPRERATRRA